MNEPFQGGCGRDNPLRHTAFVVERLSFVLPEACPRDPAGDAGREAGATAPT